MKFKPALPFNPFVESSVGDPWRSKAPDVPSIHADTFNWLLDIVRSLEMTPSAAATVLGEAGTGKTHLIKRLITSTDGDLIFVYIHPMKDHRTIFKYLLSTVITNLQFRPKSVDNHSDMNQLDYIVANVITAAFNQFLEKNPDDPGKTYRKTIEKNPLKILSFKASKKWNELLDRTKDFITKEHGQGFSPTAKDTLKALFQYPDPKKRESIITYLSGEIPDNEDAQALGLNFNEADFSIPTQEERSREILKTIGRLLVFYRPMIICFDQLENLSSKELVQAFGTLIVYLVNEVENVLPVAFVRDVTLNDSFEKFMDTPAKDRLKSNMRQLVGLNVKQGLEMIRRRLAWAYEQSDEKPPHDLFPFNEKDLREKLTGLTSPREILVEANKMMGEGPDPQNPVEVIMQAYQTEKEKMLAAQVQEPINKETVVAALKMYFGAKDNEATYAVDSLKSAQSVDLAFSANVNGDKRKVNIIVETAAHHSPIQKSFKRLENILAKGTADLAIFIRDDRNRIPPAKGRMPKTVETKDSFKKSGGKLEYLKYEELTSLYALVYVSDMIGAKDLIYISDKQWTQDTVEKSHFIIFIKDRFQSKFAEKMDKLVIAEADNGNGETEPPPVDPIILKECIKILKKAPFFYKSEQLHSKLPAKIKSQIDHDKLVQIITAKDSGIKQLPSTPPVYSLDKGTKK